ncbi:MAG TPA: hypothetical protein VGK17_24660 [Propionicimonas sp.]
MLKRRVMPVTLMAAAVVASIVVFWLFDRDSHSASDTLRPFVITIAPAWLIVTLVVHRLSRSPRSEPSRRRQ